MLEFSFVCVENACACIEMKKSKYLVSPFPEVLQLHLDKAIIEFARKLSCLEKVSRPSPLLSHVTEPSFAVSHWKLRMGTYG